MAKSEKKEALLAYIAMTSVVYRLDQEGSCITTVLDSIQKCVCIRRSWTEVAAAEEYCTTRMKKRFVEGVYQVHGFSEKNEPIVWISKAAEVYEREFATKDLVKEVVRSILYACDKALLMRPNGIETIVIHVDMTGAKPLNFHPSEPSMIAKESEALFRLCRRVVLFGNKSPSQRVFVGLAKQVMSKVGPSLAVKEFKVEKKENVRNFVSDAEKDVPPSFHDPYEWEGDAPNINHMLDGLDVESLSKLCPSVILGRTIETCSAGKR